MWETCRSFLVCSWLRVATAFIKLKASTLTTGWDDKVEDVSLDYMIAETVIRVCEADPVGGNLCIDGHKMKIWIDASSLVTGVVLEVNDNVIEDAFWFRPTGDTKHQFGRAQCDDKGYKLGPSMAGITNTSHHGLHMHSPLDLRHLNQSGTHKHKGVWRNVGEATVGNILGAWR